MSASTHSQVDLGCGSGLSTLSALNAANGLGVIGLDLSSEMLRAEDDPRKCTEIVEFYLIVFYFVRKNDGLTSQNLLFHWEK